MGKLHFDPFDNILVQVVGEKTFRLVDPGENERLLEGHMREAELEVELDDLSLLSFERRKAAELLNISLPPVRFHKYKLTESTSMWVSFSLLSASVYLRWNRVHSPIDVSDLTKSARRFPSAATVHFMDCTVRSGEALFVPSFYWHEVTSTPGTTAGESGFCSSSEVNRADVEYNLAVNHWITPLYAKEFPCATCRKYINPTYRSVIEALAGTLN